MFVFAGISHHLHSMADPGKAGELHRQHHCEMGRNCQTTDHRSSGKLRVLTCPCARTHRPSPRGSWHLLDDGVEGRSCISERWSRPTCSQRRLSNVPTLPCGKENHENQSNCVNARDPRHSVGNVREMLWRRDYRDYHCSRSEDALVFLPEIFFSEPPSSSNFPRSWCACTARCLTAKQAKPFRQEVASSLENLVSYEVFACFFVPLAQQPSLELAISVDMQPTEPPPRKPMLLSFCNRMSNIPEQMIRPSMEACGTVWLDTLVDMSTVAREPPLDASSSSWVVSLNLSLTS